MIKGAVERRVVWEQGWRIIRSIYPPIDLFEDIASPHDWELLAAVEAKTNPRIRDEIGDLGKVPADRRVSGPGASYLMAPFVHCSPLRPGRFSDGSFGIYYAAERMEVALAETIHHHQIFMAATEEPAGWTSDFRALIGAVDRVLWDVNACDGARDPAAYAVSQQIGASLRESGADGLIWKSLRSDAGDCVGLFWPDVLDVPVQGPHFSYHWNGARVDFVKRHDTDTVYEVS